MPATKIGSSDYTAMNSIDSTLTKETTFLWTVTPVIIDEATGQREYRWQNEGWEKWLGYYRVIPQIAASVDRKAIWTVGQGFDFKGGALSRFIKSKNLGMGKESLTAIFYNLDRVGQIGGDVMAEIIKDTSGRLLNLKPLNPETIVIIVNEQGLIDRYEQTTNTPNTPITFQPEQMLHIPFNRIASEIHGMSEIVPIEDTIKMLKEAKLDMKKVFHRYVKPLIISVLDSDDPIEIAAFKVKLDKAMELGENLIIPKDTVTMERMSVPQYSTLDPMPWMSSLKKDQSLFQGVPEIIMGRSEDTTEAASKIVYLAFEQMIKFRQTIWEEAIKNQLGLEIKFKFPASIQPDLLMDDKKDGQVNKKMNVNPTKHE